MALNIKILNDETIKRLISKIKDLIPTNVGDLNNDRGYITMDDIDTNVRAGNMTYISSGVISTNTLSTSTFNTYTGYTPAVNDLVIDSVGNIAVITRISGTTATVNKLLQLASVNNPTLYGLVTIDNKLTAKTLEATEKMTIPGGDISIQ